MNLTSRLLAVFFLFCLLSLIGACSSGGGDDDDTVGDDDATGDDSTGDDDTEGDDTGGDDTGDDDIADDDTSDDSADDDISSTTTTTVTTTTATTTTTVPLTVCYRDADMDGYGNPDMSNGFEGSSCPLGWVTDNTDCDDNDPLRHPGATELPDDGVDQDCDEMDFVHSDANGIFVATTGDDSNPGTMTEPVRTITTGITLAEAAGKSVFVAEGEYVESVTTTVALFGGYESTGWTRDIPGHLTTITSSDSTAVTVMEGASVVIQGFTINGGGSGFNLSYGVYNSGIATLVNNVINGGSGHSESYGLENIGTSTLVNNDIEGGSGGNSIGVYILSGIGSLMNNEINGGSGLDFSTGVEISNCKATILNNRIEGGLGPGFSTGVFTYYGTVSMVDNIIAGGFVTSNSYGLENYYGTVNTAGNVIAGGSGSFHCSGVTNEFGTLTMVNDLINGGSGNPSYGTYGIENYDLVTIVNSDINGGSGPFETYGIYNGGTAILVNDTIDGGTGSSISFGIFNLFSPVTLVNNDIWGSDEQCMVYLFGADLCINTPAIVNACGWYGCTAASGNISADPLFVDPFNSDFHLQSTSPCIDAGIDPIPDYLDPSFAGIVDFDFDGNPRPYGAAWDIGAYEWTP